jgi:hypothetical protein
VFEPFYLWLLTVALFFSLPGILSTDYVEMFRVVLLQPLLPVFAFLGLMSFLSAIPARKRTLFIVVTLGLSTFADLALLAYPPSHGKVQPSCASLQASRLLFEETRQSGPGFLLTDFSPLEHNHALSAIVFGVNASVNPRLAHLQPSWVGLTTQADYLPFLQKRFPEGRWTSIPGTPGDPAYAVGILPLTNFNRKKLEPWVTAHRFFHEQQLLVENVFASRKKYSTAIAHLRGGMRLVEGDPFLETVYGEWAAQYYWDPKQSANIGYLRRAVEKGYATERLVEKWVGLLVEIGEIQAAESVRVKYGGRAK